MNAPLALSAINHLWVLVIRNADTKLDDYGEISLHQCASIYLSCYSFHKIKANDIIGEGVPYHEQYHRSS